MRYVARQGAVPPRRIRRPRDGRCGEGSPFLICPWDRPEIWRVSDVPMSGWLQTGNGVQPGRGGPARKGKAAAPVRPLRPQPAPWTASGVLAAPSSQAVATSVAAASHRTRADGDEARHSCAVRHESRRGRCVGVDAAASQASGPGIPTSACRCVSDSAAASKDATFRRVAPGRYGLLAVRPLLASGRVWPRGPSLNKRTRPASRQRPARA